MIKDKLYSSTYVLKMSSQISSDFDNLKLKLNDKNSVTICAISNRIKYWNISYWADLSLPSFSLLREENQSVSFQSASAGMTNSSQLLPS